MSSINPYYTFQYSQPEEYHFSHDSVFLARKVFEFLEENSRLNLHEARCLDLCAGCGIVGLDFLFHLQSANKKLPKSFAFVEVQQIYNQHFLKNSQNINAIAATQLQFLNFNYERLLEKEFYQSFDLILCNPPYFFSHQGKLSPSEFKNRCRFYIDSDFKNLLLAIGHCLSPKGQAYVLLRDLPQYQWHSILEAEKIYAKHFAMAKQVGSEQTGKQIKLKIHPIDSIRGTQLVRINY